MSEEEAIYMKMIYRIIPPMVFSWIIRLLMAAFWHNNSSIVYFFLHDHILELFSAFGFLLALKSAFTKDPNGDYTLGKKRWSFLVVFVMYVVVAWCRFLIDLIRFLSIDA